MREGHKMCHVRCVVRAVRMCSETVFQLLTREYNEGSSQNFPHSGVKTAIVSDRQQCFPFAAQRVG